MSRTDIHRPVWVMMQDPTIRHWFRDQHNHHRGPCDLDEFLAAKGCCFQRFRCWRQLWHATSNVCGCLMCTQQVGRRHKRRAERGMWRSTRRQLLKTNVTDLDDVDLPPLQSQLW